MHRLHTETLYKTSITCQTLKILPTILLMSLDYFCYPIILTRFSKYFDTVKPILLLLWELDTYKFLRFKSYGSRQERLGSSTK